MYKDGDDDYDSMKGEKGSYRDDYVHFDYTTDEDCDVEALRRERSRGSSWAETALVAAKMAWAFAMGLFVAQGLLRRSNREYPSSSWGTGAPSAEVTSSGDGASGL